MIIWKVWIDVKVERMVNNWVFILYCYYIFNFIIYIFVNVVVRFNYKYICLFYFVVFRMIFYLLEKGYLFYFYFICIENVDRELFFRKLYKFVI